MAGFNLLDVTCVAVDDDIMLWNGVGETDDGLVEDAKAVTASTQEAVDLIQQEVRRGKVDASDYTPAADYLWQCVGGERTRRLDVVTYGKRWNLQPPPRVESTFDASCINSIRWLTRRELHHLRGTDRVVQQETRYGAGFVPFFKHLVRTIEEQDLVEIAIVCKSGYHRSVACAELLKWVYPLAIVTHLTVERR
jgi:hypothetical protein